MTQLPMGFYEQVIYTLRSLYSQYGYTQYKMSKFEEYDLYARNRDFLISDSVITFTDANGKLMALKPDVTLSIVKNSKDMPDTVQKLYYNENVYRAPKGSRSFREMTQVGLECLGKVDDYCICEVLMLAAQSLQSISGNSVLNISHLGLLSDLFAGVGIPEKDKAAAIKAVGEKNTRALEKICRDADIKEERIALLKQAVVASGAPDAVLSVIRKAMDGIAPFNALDQLLAVTGALKGTPVYGMLRFDLSVVDDVNYYNGIVFKGFVDGVPSSVLSGGQYDKLMQKMGRKSCAIGFAVYLDTLERLEQREKNYDVDTVLLYEEGAELSVLLNRAEELTQKGNTVTVLRQLPENIRYRQLMKLRGSEVEILENNA